MRYFVEHDVLGRGWIDTPYFQEVGKPLSGYVPSKSCEFPDAPKDETLLGLWTGDVKIIGKYSDPITKRVQAVVTDTPCSRECWDAKGLKCACSCGGQNHGIGRDPNRLEEYQELLDKLPKQ